MHRDMFKIQDGVAIVEKLNSKAPLSSLETRGCEPNVVLSGWINIEDNAQRAVLMAL